MILSKVIVNQVAGYLANHFKLDKVMNYVFDDNELDDKVRIIEDKVKLLELIAHPEREFVVCEKCKKQIEEKKNG
jgi:hypothetical protein